MRPWLILAAKGAERNPTRVLRRVQQIFVKFCDMVGVSEMLTPQLPDPEPIAV